MKILQNNTERNLYLLVNKTYYKEIYFCHLNEAEISGSEQKFYNRFLK